MHPLNLTNPNNPTNPMYPDQVGMGGGASSSGGAVGGSVGHGETLATLIIRFACSFFTSLASACLFVPFAYLLLSDSAVAHLQHC
jgi:hypothetical protein